jgi:enoyl-CoA hydratase
MSAAPSSSQSDSPVIVEIKGSLGCIRLNRPRALNSLTLDMVRRIASALDAFAQDAAVAAVLISGEGDRGFCAGGDIRAIYESGRTDGVSALTFWREEYRLNAKIKHFAKPYIALMDGITMGGGVGLSAHGAIRIVTERTRLAMPETGIGYFPDVGGTWLLARSPGQVGVYLGLTGEIIGAGDAIFAGLADLMIGSSQIPHLQAELSILAPGIGASEIQRRLSFLASPPEPGPVEMARRDIDRFFVGDDVETMVSRLNQSNQPFASQASATLSTKSPTSVKLALRLIRLGQASSTLEQCLEREFAADHQILKGHDFYEGVRAAILDKDRTPQWAPANLRDVTDDAIDAYLKEAPAPVFGSGSMVKEGEVS